MVVSSLDARYEDLRFGIVLFGHRWAYHLFVILPQRLRRRKYSGGWSSLIELHLLMRSSVMD